MRNKIPHLVLLFAFLLTICIFAVLDGVDSANPEQTASDVIHTQSELGGLHERLNSLNNTEVASSQNEVLPLSQRAALQLRDSVEILEQKLLPGGAALDRKTLIRLAHSRYPYVIVSEFWNPGDFSSDPERIEYHLADRLLVDGEIEPGSALAELVESEKWQLTKRVPFSPVYHLMLGEPSLETLEQALSILSELDHEVHFSMSSLMFPSLAPNDPQYTGGNQWNLDKIQAPAAWDTTTGSPDAIVAVIDGGCDIDHVDLVGNLWSNPLEIPGNGIDDDLNGLIDDVTGWDFRDEDKFVDDNNHGTHTAGTVGAVGNNSIGVAGVSWNTKILPIRGGGFDTADAIQATDYVTMLKADYGYNIIATSNSYGSRQSSPNSSFVAAIERARDAGILVVAGAGNDSVDLDSVSDPFYPAAYATENIIAVTASNESDNQQWNYGATSVDLGAPGTNIRSTIPGDTYGNLSGTSMATPHVSGAAALVRAANPDLQWTEVKQIILDSVDSGVGNFTGRVSTDGRLNVASAVVMAHNYPRASLVHPILPAMYPSGADIHFYADASDTDGSIASVKFYVDDTLVHTDSDGSDGWSYVWSGGSDGNHEVYLEVTDDSGNTTVTETGALYIAHMTMDDTSPGAVATLAFSGETNDVDAIGGSYRRYLATNSDGYFSYLLNIPLETSYTVSLFWPSTSDRSIDALVRIKDGSGSNDLRVNQSATFESWVPLSGTYNFTAGRNMEYVQISDEGSTESYSIGQQSYTYRVLADAIRLTPDFSSNDVVSVVAHDPSAHEDGLDAGGFTFVRGKSSGDLTVSYTVGGDATGGSDYDALSGSVTIPDGQYSATVSVAPKSDADASEGAEAVSVTLTAATGQIIGSPSSAEVIIQDGPIVTIPTTDVTVNMSNIRRMQGTETAAPFDSNYINGSTSIGSGSVGYTGTAQWRALVLIDVSGHLTDISNATAMTLTLDPAWANGGGAQPDWTVDFIGVTSELANTTDDWSRPLYQWYSTAGTNVGDIPVSTSLDPVTLDVLSEVQGSGADATNRYLIFRVSSLNPPDLTTNYQGALSTNTTDNFLTISTPPANAAPTADPVSISGTPVVGQQLTGSYVYDDADGDLEGSSVLKWYRSADASFGGDLEIGTGSTYTLTALDEGNYLFFEVQPIAQTGETDGAATQSPPTVPVMASSTPANGKVDLFFIGGQSNATSAFRDGVEQSLREADRWDNPVVVHEYHPGQQISTWYDGAAVGANYETDFKNGSGTGALETKIAELQAAGNTVNIAGFFWFQGEGDTATTDQLNNYAARFTSLLDQLATDLNGGSPIPFAITLISANPDGGEPFTSNPSRIDNVDALRAVQRGIAEASDIGVWADSKDYPRADAWHLSEADRTLFGAELAEAFLANLEGNALTCTKVSATAIRAFGTNNETYSGGTLSPRIAFGWANTHTSEQVWKTMLAIDLSDTATREALLAHDTITLDIDSLPTVPSDGGPFRVVYAGLGNVIPANGANAPVNSLWTASVAPQVLGILNGGTVGVSFDVTSLLKGLDFSGDKVVYFRIETTHPGPNAALSGTTSAFLEPATDAVQLVGCTAVLPKKILPLGDSITNGTRGSFVGSGYRYYLENFLIAYGYEPGVDYAMVGSKGNGYRTDPDTGSGAFMKQWLNSGRGGWSIPTTLSGGDLYGTQEPSLADLVADQDPDIVMVMLGTNDVNLLGTDPLSSTEINTHRTNYRSLLDTLLAQNPEVQVIMAKIPPYASTTATAAPVNADRIEPFNNEVVQVIFNEYASEHPGWKLIDNYSVLDATTPTDDFDASDDPVHPIDRGHERMARNWFSALLEILEGDDTAVLTGVTEPNGQDALLRGGADAANALNTGTDWATRGIRLDADPAAPEKALLRFDVSALPTDAGRTVLGLTWVGASTANADNGGISSAIHVYGVADGADSWDESTVTWNSAPGNDTASPSAADVGSTTYLGSITVPADIIPGDTIALRSAALTSFVNSGRGADELVTLLLTTDSSSYTTWLGELANANYHPAFLIADAGRGRPSELTGVVLSESTVRLEWIDQNTDETGFTLQRRPSGTAEWITVSASIAANSTSYLDSSLSAGSYEFRLRADGTASGATDWSNCSVVTAQRVDPATRVYEPFDYADSLITDDTIAQADGGTGFSGKWSNTGSPTEAAAFEASSLSVASNPFVTQGGAVGAGALGNTASRALLPHNTIDLDADGVVYFSFLFRSGSLNFNHLAFTGTGDSITVGNRARSSDNTPLWRAVAGSGTQGTSETPSITLSQAYFLAGRLVTSASGNEQLQFTAYGPADAVPASEPGSFLVNSIPAALTGTISGISLTGGDAANPTGFDEIRIGDTWAAVTAPASYQSFSAWATSAGIPAATAATDLNGNGVADGIEYLTDTGSSTALDRLPQLVLAQDGSDEYLSIDLTLAPGATDFGLFVQESDDLIDWQTIWRADEAGALNHPLVLDIASNGATQTLWIRASKPMDTVGRGFIRVGIDE